jgi:hypothetical protein
MEFLAAEDLRTHASAMRAGGLFLPGAIFEKTDHALLFGRDDADIQFRFSKGRIGNERVPLLAELVFVQQQFTDGNPHGIEIGGLLENLADKRG